MTKGLGPKWDTLPKTQSQTQLFSTISLASGMDSGTAFQANISIIK